MTFLSSSMSTGARRALSSGIRTSTSSHRRILAAPVAPIHHVLERGSSSPMATMSTAATIDQRHRNQLQHQKSNFSSANTSTATALTDMLKAHRVFERVEIKPGNMFHVLNIIEEASTVNVGTTLQQTIVQELAGNDMAEMDDMYYIVGCALKGTANVAKGEGCYDRVDDASDYHSLKEYLIGYKTHSFQMAVLPTLDENEDGILAELVRITQPGGFVVYSSSDASSEASVLTTAGKWKLIEEKHVGDDILNLFKVEE